MVISRLQVTASVYVSLSCSERPRHVLYLQYRTLAEQQTNCVGGPSVRGVINTRGAVAIAHKLVLRALEWAPARLLRSLLLTRVSFLHLRVKADNVCVTVSHMGSTIHS